MRIPFTVIAADGTTIEDTAKSRDAIAYEDHFRVSWDATAGDPEGNLRSAAMWRVVWIVLRARHGETRPFDVWLDALDDDEFRIVLGHTAPLDPTGEPPIRSDAESRGSSSEPDSIPSDSAISTKPGSPPSKSKQNRGDASQSTPP